MPKGVKNMSKTLKFLGYRLGNQLVKDILKFIKKTGVTKTTFLARSTRFFLEHHDSIEFYQCPKCGSEDMVASQDGKTTLCKEKECGASFRDAD